MDTTQLRTLHATACQRLHGKLWPNQLGFDARRWEYTWSEIRHQWYALWRPRGYGNGEATRVGLGDTPEAARMAARRVEAD